MEEVEGGYVVSNGRGQGISFAIHHAPPQVAKLSLKVPSEEPTDFQNEKKVTFKWVYVKISIFSDP